MVVKSEMPMTFVISLKMEINDPVCNMSEVMKKDHHLICIKWWSGMIGKRETGSDSHILSVVNKKRTHKGCVSYDSS